MTEQKNTNPKDYLEQEALRQITRRNLVVGFVQLLSGIAASKAGVPPEITELPINSGALTIASTCAGLKHPVPTGIISGTIFYIGQRLIDNKNQIIK